MELIAERSGRILVELDDGRPALYDLLRDRTRLIDPPRLAADIAHGWPKWSGDEELRRALEARIEASLAAAV